MLDVSRSSAFDRHLPSHIRHRVESVVATPPPGTYDGPVTVSLSCTTPLAVIRYTLDGTVPYANSDRDHGYRCTRYSPRKPIVLQGAGQHTITVVATSAGLVETRPQTLVFRLLSGPEAPRSRAELYREAVLNRQFNLAASHEQSMPFEFAKGGKASPVSPTTGLGGSPVTLALLETTSRRTLEALRRQGSHVELFKLAGHGERVGSSAYRRIVPPSLSLTLPPDPLKARRRSQPNSLRSMPDGAAVTYDAPRYPPLQGRQTADDATVFWDLASPDEQAPDATAVVPLFDAAGSRPASREQIVRYGSSSRPLSRTSTAQGTHRFATPAYGSRPVSRLTTRSATPSSASKTSAQQLAWFEVRGNLSAAGEDDDKEETKQEALYQQAQSTAVNEELLRVGRISEKFVKTYATASPVASDPASESRRFLLFLLHATAARKTCLRRLLSQVSYADVARGLERRLSTTPVELAALPGVTISQNEFGKLFRELELGSSVACSTLLQLLRFVVWAVRRVPEAVLVLLVEYKAGLSVAADKVVTRVEATAALDVYRRARGAHPLLEAQLRDVIANGITWSDSDDVELTAWTETCRSIALLGAAMGQLADFDRPMYNEPLPLYT
jgi:hypothetical protein